MSKVRIEQFNPNPFLLTAWTYRHRHTYATDYHIHDTITAAAGNYHNQDDWNSKLEIERNYRNLSSRLVMLTHVGNTFMTL